MEGLPAGEPSIGLMKRRIIVDIPNKPNFSHKPKHLIFFFIFFPPFEINIFLSYFPLGVVLNMEKDGVGKTS